MTTSRRAVIYCRVSTEQQGDDGTSLDSQEARCRDYCAQHDLLVVGAFRDTYSGAKYRERPGLSRLRELVRGRQVDVVVAYAIDRLSRNQAHLAIIAEEAADHGVELEFVTEAFEDSAIGRFIRNARAFAAEIEREKIAERTVRGKRHRIESGLLPRAGRELYGYVRDHDINRRIIIDDEAEVVRTIYRWYLEGVSIRSIASRLNDSGIPSPSPDPAARWGKTQVTRMLRDRTYTGETIFWRWAQTNGGRGNPARRPREEWLTLDGLTPAIVSRDDWERVQARLDARSGAQTRNVARPRLLRGLIWCGVCGQRMYTDSERGKPVYRCASRETLGAPCGGSRSPGAALDAEVWDAVCAEIRRMAASDEIVVNPTDLHQDELDGLERRLAAIQRAQDRLISRVAASDVLRWEHVERELARGDAERKLIQSRIGEIRDARANADTLRRQASEVRSTVVTVAGTLDAMTIEERRWVLEQLGVRVFANGTRWQIAHAVQVF